MRMDKRKKKGRKVVRNILIGFSIGLLGTATMVGGYIYNTVNKYEGRIYPGVKVETIYLNGKSGNQALNMVNNKYQQAILKKNVIINTPNKDYTIEYKTLNARYNIEETIDIAMKYGKDKNILEKFKLIKNPIEYDLKLQFAYDESPIQGILDNIERDIYKDPVNASIIKDKSGEFIITPEEIGQALDKEQLKRDLNEKINGNINNDIIISAEIKEKKPKIQKEALEKINGKISSYTTDFATSSINRATNIKLATSAINGLLLMPGDAFSFNDVVGKRTVEKGYKDAPVIINNELVPGIGGGICQVSTTLFNAVVRANIPSTERINHTMPSHYVGLGMDATVDYGNIDYKFKNILPYPIYIEAYDNNRKLVFNVYSDASITNKTYDIVNEIENTIEPTIKYIEDSNLAQGKEVIENKGMTGYKVKVYKVAYENGKEVSKEFLHEDYYAPIAKKIRIGVRENEVIANKNN